VLTLIAQLAPVPGGLATNASRLEDALADYPNVELAVFPELSLSGYELPGAAELSLSEDDRRFRDLREAAARRLEGQVPIGSSGVPNEIDYLLQRPDRPACARAGQYQRVTRKVMR
jgi:predicted amidohydrolase